MHMNKHTIAWGLVLILAVTATAFAARKGRLVGRVVDSEDNPISGVTVTAPSDHTPDFRVV